MFNQSKMYLWYQKQVADEHAETGMKSVTKHKTKTHKKHQSDEMAWEQNQNNFPTVYNSTLLDGAVNNNNDDYLAQQESVDITQEGETEEDLYLTETNNDGIVDCDEDGVAGISGDESGRRSSSPDAGHSICNYNIMPSIMSSSVTSLSNSNGNRRHKIVPKRRENYEEVSDFVDTEFWKMKNICCGTIFKGPRDELLIDYRFIKPCKFRSKMATSPSSSTSL